MPANHAQRRAIEADPWIPLVVQAGPGTGKTYILVERIATLLQALGRARQGGRTVVALTFTRNAAHELQSRLSHLGAQSEQVEVRTAHSFGLSLLRDGWARAYLGLDPLSVASRETIAQVVLEATSAFDLDVTPAEAIALVEDVKLGRPTAWEPRLAAAILQRYNDRLAAAGLIDIHDMVVKPVELLRQHESARRDLALRVGHMVGDEAQDWSRYQAALAAYAAGPAGLLSAVGDPAQAIYGGSSPRFLIELPGVYRSATLVTLEHTYRLHRQVLTVASAVGAHIAGARMTGAADRAHGPAPLLFIGATPDEEADWIAHDLHTLRSGGLPAWADATVLVRTRYQRDVLADRLRARGVPCRTRLARVADRPLVVAVMAWLTLVQAPHHTDALLRAIDAPPRARQRSHPRSLRAALAREGDWTITRLARDYPRTLTDWQKNELAAFVRQYNRLAQLFARTHDLALLLDAVLEVTGLLAWLTRTHGQAVLDDLAALRAVLAEAPDLGTLQHLVGEEPGPEARDAILVTTVHGFKGEEREAIYVAGVDDGWFPHYRALAGGTEGLQAELRAFYVGITRARQWLRVSCGCFPPGGAPQGRPSSFLSIVAPSLRSA